MKRNNFILPFFKWKFDNDDRRLLEKELSEKINYLGGEDKPKLDSLNEKVRAYTEKLDLNDLRDENIARTLDWGWLRYLSLVIGFPVFIAGYLSNLIPFLLPRFICSKLIKDLRFYSSVFISSGTVLYLIYFPLIVILSLIFAGLPGFLLALLVPLAGYMVLYYQEIFCERVGRLRFVIKSKNDPSLITELKRHRAEILAELEVIKLPVG